MADNNGQVNVQYGLDASQASAQLKKLETDLKSITANLIQAQGVIETNLKRMTADITASLAKAKAGTAQFNALVRREERVTGNILSSQGRGTRTGQLTGAAGNALISEIRNSADQTTAKIADELVKAYTQRLRTVDDVVAARIRGAQYANTRTIANNTQSALAARQVLAERRLQDQQYSAQFGQAALTTRNRMAAFNEDGGSGIIAIQSRLMANYAALSLAFNAMKGLGTFVVQLDKEFRQFQAITATTSTEMVGLKDRLLEVSEASKFSAVQIAQASVILGQAGLSAREVADSIGAISLLATAAGSELTEAVDLVTSTMSIFNLTTNQTTDVANVMTSALNLSKLTVDKLVLGFQYAGNTAAQMGISFQELTGVLGALANSGIRSGSTLGTGLRQLLIDIQNPTEKFSEALAALGLSEQDVNVEANGLLPVLRTLQQAGFGAAQAFESFEVRAAAAYVALSNNIDLAAKLQEQFTLSSAAVEANAIQMESLANTYDRFVSIVGSQAYRAFDPVMQALQDLIKLTADFISQLDQIPGLLEVIGVLMATAFSAVVLSSIGALVRGLSMAIPLLGTFATGLTTVGVAGATTTGILGTLWTLVARHPFVLVASAIVGVVSALYAFGNAGQSAAERVDVLKAQVNEFKGQIDAANDEIVGINQTIDNLIKQKAALDADPLMRTNRMLEVKQAFTEIANEVDTTTGSVDDLINALRELATTDFAKMNQSITEALFANRALMSQYETNIQTQLQSAPLGVREQLGMTLASDTEIMDLFAQNLGEQFGKYAAMAMGAQALPDDISKVTAIGADVNTEIARQTSRQNILTNKRKLGTITEAEATELGNIPTYLSLLQILKDNLQPLVANRTNLAQLEVENEILENDRINAAVSSTFQYQDLAKDVDTLSAQIGVRFNEMMAATKGKTAEEVLKMFEALETEFAGRLDALSAKSENYAQNISTTPGVDATPEQVGNVLKTLTDRMASIRARISTVINTENAEFQKVREEVLKDELKTIDQAMNSVKRQTSRANTQAELDYIRDYVSKKFDEKRRITAEIYGSELAGTNDLDEQLGIQSELREAQRQINIEEQTAMEDLLQRSLDNKQRMIDDTKAAIDDEIQVTRDKMDELLQAIARAKPGPAVDALIAQFNLLSQALDQMTQQSNSLGIQSGILSTQGRPVPSSMTGRANEAMQFFMSRGMSRAQAAGIVGNLMAESGMSPTIYGDRGSAYGLAQWRGDRQVGLSQFAARRGVDRSDFMTQLEYILQELPNNGGTEFAGARTPAEAADIFRRLFERPSADPVLGAHGRRIEYANTLAGVDYSGQTQSTIETGTDLAQAKGKAIKAAFEAVEREIAKPVQDAQLALKAAQSPENVNRFTSAQITGLQNNLTAAENAAKVKELAAAEKYLADIRRELAAATAQYGEGSVTQNYWLAEEAEALEKVNSLTREKNAADAAMTQQSPSVNAAIQSATQAWAIQNGILDQVTGKIIPLSKQIEASWGQVLDVLTDGFSNLFVDLVSGTMTAEEAFKKFGKSVVDQLLQMISKALAMQLIMAALGGESGTAGGGTGNFLGTLLGGMFGVTGSANGEIVPGFSNRDSVLRKVMPGEAILRKSTVNALGRDNVRSLNAMGNRISSESIAPANDNVAVPGVTNVWVVTPDQVPPLGPNDIVAVVSDNIARGGSVKQMIKSVVTGG